MAKQSLGIAQNWWFPLPPDGITHLLSTSVYVMDASGELAALCFRVPRTGTIDRFGAIVAISNTPDNGLRFSFQDLVNGLPDGVVDQFATVPSGSLASGFVDPGAFDASRSVTRNDPLALVVDFPSFVAGDSVTVQSTTNGNNGSWGGFPLGVSVTNTKNGINLPQMYLHYTDDGGIWVPASVLISPYTTLTTLSMDTGTSPDEAGMAFTLPYPCTLDRVIVSLNMTAAGSDFDLILYDDADNILSTASHDGDNISSTAAQRELELLLDEEIDLSAGSLYRIVIKPTTLTNVALAFGTIPSTIFSIAPGAGLAYLTARVDGGAWTNFNNGTDGYRLPTISLGISAWDDGEQTPSARSWFPVMGGGGRGPAGILPSGMSNG